MLFLTHLLFGILIALVARGFISGGNYWFFFGLVLLGSVLSDVDNRNSKITKYLGLPGKIVSFFSKHRGFFHSMLFVVLLTVVLKLFLGDYYAWGLFLGLVGHLFMDSMSKNGINLFYPFLDVEIKGWVRVGNWQEMMIRVLLVGLIVWTVVW
ncbi:metal-dependent hydrolase [Candidatus Woesearchaeota archaeon]|nr:metal-dependent hydrolase [Candidatus Woesearchaeota archaeon]